MAGAKTGFGGRVLYAVPTGDQLVKWWYEVKSALRPILDADTKHFKVNETNHTIERVGTQCRIRGKTAWNAATLRGDFADTLILDEVQLMSEDTWGEVGAPMLLDNNGDAIFIYTPPSLLHRGGSKARDKRWITKLAQYHADDPDGRWKMFSFTSFDNPHISKEALKEITGDMTSIAFEQEIMAREFDNAPGALWRRIDIDDGRVLRAPKLERIVVAVDPSASSAGAQAGIVVAGRTRDQFYTLDDLSIQGSPQVWATAAVTAYYKHKADAIVAEKNNGGEMVRAVIQQVDPLIRVKLVHASRGKQARAEPIVAITEQGRDHHVGTFPDLEDEMCVDESTLIATPVGQMRIANLRQGHRVMTSRGPMEVEWVGQTGTVNEVMELTLRNGLSLLLTENHPVWTTDRGFIRADMLRNGERVGVLPAELDRNREYREILVELPSRKSFAENSEPLELSHVRIQALTGEALNVLRVNYEKGRQWLTVMGEAGMKTKSQADATPPTPPTADVASPVARIRRVTGKRAVWNLSVAEQPEYYANGVLVHNCLWMPGDPSPNRLDAKVWALTELQVGELDWEGAKEFGHVPGYKSRWT